MVENRRVVHKEHGAGQVIDHAFIGPVPVTYVKFDSQKEEMLVSDSELEPDIKKLEIDNDLDKKTARERKLEEIRAESLKEMREIEDMNNGTLVEAFEHIVRRGTGPGARRVVFMKREILRRMNKGDCLWEKRR